MNVPTVVIVGRPNVGKSSLLNALAGERVSIVDRTPGVTRDRVSVHVQRDGGSFELIDTGGIGLVDRHDLEADIEAQIQVAVECADLVLFVTDTRAGPVAEDASISQRLRRLKAPVIVVPNKADGESFEPAAWEFAALGLGDPIPVSATQRRGLADLSEAILERLPRLEKASRSGLKIALLGRRNVGKSTLLNALANENRVLVSEVPGTTRDAVDVRVQFEGKELTVIDTAGIRKRKQVAGSVDFYSQNRTVKAVKRCDVAFLILDATEPVARLDKQLAGEIVENHKPCCILVNKWDLVQEAGPEEPGEKGAKGGGLVEEYAGYISRNLPGLGFAPIVYVSALKGMNLTGALEVAFSLDKQAALRVGTGELNRVVARLLKSSPPPRSGRYAPKIYFATQVGVSPPTFVFFVNQPKVFPGRYRRYIAGKFREEFGFSEIPLRLIFRQRISSHE